MRRTARARAVDRYLQLRPVIKAQLEATVPDDLQREFAKVTAHQVRALVMLPEPGLTMYELASAMGITGATASVLADRLVTHGLITRAQDDSDRRVVRLLLTERGRHLAARYRDAERKQAETMFSRLTDTQVAAWLDVLETLAAPGSGDATAGSRLEAAP
jgi:DNA-binding MarR family transcriptional regulator